MAATAGSIRFNTDSSKLEIYNGEKWWEIDSTSPDVQTGGTRGLFGAGATPSIVDTIDYINVASTGDAIDFGNMTRNSRGVGGLSSRSRGVFCGGYDPGYQNIIEYVTISSTGNAVDFGDLNAAGSTNGVMQSTGASSNGHGGL